MARKIPLPKPKPTPRRLQRSQQMASAADYRDPRSAILTSDRRSIRVVSAPDGGALRQIITGRSWIGTASYPSAKTRRSQPVEGRTEDLWTLRCEVDPEVLDYQNQPFRLEGITDSGPITYIVDQIRLLRSGVRELVEGKCDVRAATTERALARKALALEFCEAADLRYRLVLRDELMDRTEVEAIDLIQTYRFVIVTERHAQIAAHHLADSDGVSTIGELARLLEADPVRGLGIICSMMVRGLLAIDLTRRINRDSIVRAVKPIAGSLPKLRFV